MDVTTARLLHHAGAPRSAGDEHPNYYVGRRSVAVGGLSANLTVQAVGRHAVRSLRHHRRWSMDGFDWAADSAGTIELAYALLEDLTGLYPSAELCRELAGDVLVHLPADGFVLADTDLLGWLESRSDR